MSGEDRLRAVFEEIGLCGGMHLCLHVSMQAVRKVDRTLRAEDLAWSLMQAVGPNGSLLVPTFTYNWKRIDAASPAFDPFSTPSAVGAFSEAFRRLPGVIRTEAPTHSFALWGRASREIGSSNAPSSPLGEGSPLDWLARQPSAYVLLLGTHFDSLSLIHYAETIVPLATIDRFPWAHCAIKPIGVSAGREQQLEQIPGCSKSFRNLEHRLMQEGRFSQREIGGVKLFLLEVGELLRALQRLFSDDPGVHLCPVGSCPACDERREPLVEQSGRPPHPLKD